MARCFLLLLLVVGVSAFAEDATPNGGRDEVSSEEWGSPPVDVPVDAADDDWSDDWSDDWESDEQGWLPLTGFAEAAAGSRWQEDEQVGRYATLLDLRWRLESGWDNDALSVTLKGDLLYDGVDQDFAVDVRDLSAAFSPVKSVDMKIGRQVLTWGTGDLLFLNDLFPKDWVSFFAGRNDEYLKAPSNSMRLTQYNKLMNVDFVWTPKFTPDIYIDGKRFSYFSPFDGRLTGQEPPIYVDPPSATLSNGEFSLRLFKNYRGVEYALYGYRGFFKAPSEIVGPYELTFAPMTSIGGSVRRPLGPGLFNIETSYYLSRDDRDGTNPLIANSQLRFLAGYEWEAARNFNVGLQYYVEHVADHDKLLENSPMPQFEPPENRHVVTTRLTYRAMQEKLEWSFFAYLSPNDLDAYLRPIVAYRVNDHWTTTFGLNLFGGEDSYTFLGQFEDNSNAYIRIRYYYY